MEELVGPIGAAAGALAGVLIWLKQMEKDKQRAQKAPVPIPVEKNPKTQNRKN